MRSNDFNIEVNVGGVPEHFNLAWHLAIEKGWFAKEGIKINWHDVKGGTGAMCKMLSEQNLDIAIALTEGVVAEIVNNNAPLKIAQFYVNSPLKWGIYTGYGSGVTDLKNIEKLKFAISRYNSGSHLMAYVLAEKNNKQLHHEQFLVVGNLDGAREALTSNQAQLFMWEKFTTKFLVEKGDFRLLGECSTPWPCFVVTVNNQFLKNFNNQLHTILNIINKSCFKLKYTEPEAVEMVAWRYHIKVEDATNWFKELEYNYVPEIDEIEFVSILNDLKKFGIIKRLPNIDEICLMSNVVS